MNGRMCVFCSHSVLHRVLSCSATRYCVSMMFYGNNTAFPNKLLIPRELGPILGPLCSPQNARALVFVLFEEECCASMLDTFVETPEGGLARAVESFRRRVGRARNGLPPAIKELLESKLPLPHPLL